MQVDVDVTMYPIVEQLRKNHYMIPVSTCTTQFILFYYFIIFNFFFPLSIKGEKKKRKNNNNEFTMNLY
jgi:hypothetical protein